MIETVHTQVCLNNVFLAFLAHLNNVLSAEPTDKLYYPDHGMCRNFSEFCLQRYSNIIDLIDDDDEYSDERFLQELFANDGLDETYPFNSEAFEPSYYDDRISGTVYQNPRRLKWIAEKLLACGIKPSFKYTGDLSSSTEPAESVEP